MKRLALILVSSLLSMMIVFMGAGVSVICCEHSGTVRLAQLTEWNAPDDGCNMDAECMRVDLVQLSPLDAAHQPVFDFHSFQNVLAVIGDLKVNSLGPWNVQERMWLHPEAYISPPRSYLNILRVLLI